MSTLVVTASEDLERRARVLPWGIQVEVWRLVETLTLPPSAGSLSINTLFRVPDKGAIPEPRDDDEKTLENPVSGPDLDLDVDLAYDEMDGGDL